MRHGLGVGAFFFFGGGSLFYRGYLGFLSFSWFSWFFLIFFSLFLPTKCSWFDSLFLGFLSMRAIIHTSQEFRWSPVCGIFETLSLSLSRKYKLIFTVFVLKFSFKLRKIQIRRKIYQEFFSLNHARLYSLLSNLSI